MFWNRKPRIVPAEFADALLDDWVGSATFDGVKHLGLEGPELARFEEKAHRYRVASVLLELAKEERSNPRFAAVRTELERKVFPPTPTESAMLILEQFRGAMKDLNELSFPNEQRKEMSWARNWLLDIGLDVSNPATLTVLALYWLDFQIETLKLLRSIKIA
jgi:hypothetical protein